MAEIRLNEVNGTRMAWSMDSGKEYTRIFSVRGIDATGKFSGALELAIQQTGLLPGSPHPSISGLIVERIEAQPATNSKEDSRIMARYIDTNTVYASITGSLTRENTHWAIDDTKYDRRQWMRIVYRPGEQPNVFIDPDGNQKRATDLTQPGTIEAFMPSPIIEFKFIYFASALVNLAGKINAKRWQNGRPFTWLCTDASARVLPGTIRSGHTRGKQIRAWHEHRLAFQWKGAGRDSWAKDVYYVDRNLGVPPAGVVPKSPEADYLKNRGNGYRQYLGQPPVDFTFLDNILPLICPDMDSLQPIIVGG